MECTAVKGAPHASHRSSVFLVKKGHNSRNLAFRVIPLSCKTAPCHNEQRIQEFGDDTFNTF